jgi:hypothetical protein
MPTLIAVVAEAREDAEVCVGLTKRVVAESAMTPDWIREDPEQLAEELRFAGLEPETEFTQRRRIRAIAEERALPHKRAIQRLRSFGSPIGEDFADTWKVVALAALDDRNFDAVIVSRDTDGISERWDSWKEVRNTSGPKPLVILAAQHCKLEAWLLNGFVPKDEADTGRLREEKSSLGFDPVRKAERLTAKADQAKKSAKRVLKRVTDDNPGRRRNCWEQTDLMLLRENGERTGLKEFLDAVEASVIPLIVRS